MVELLAYALGRLSCFAHGRNRQVPYAGHKQPDANWLRFDGGLTWDADDERNEIASVYRHEKNIGYDALLLRAEQVAAMTPGINVSAITPQGAIFNPGEGWVDLPSLIRTAARRIRSPRRKTLG